MELLPGVAPAASEPKFKDSSSMSTEVAVRSNSCCRKVLFVPWMLVPFAQEAIRFPKYDQAASCAFYESKSLQSPVPKPTRGLLSMISWLRRVLGFTGVFWKSRWSFL